MGQPQTAQSLTRRRGDSVRAVDYEQIIQEQRDDIVLLTLNRPDKLNAWTPRMSAELVDAIEAADSDASVGALVVTGAGRGFCAGADISAVFDAQLSGEAASSTPAATPARTRDWVELIRSTKPIVAAVNGPAVGVGLTMILPFDRIVVGEGAKLSVRFVKMGLVPGARVVVIPPSAVRVRRGERPHAVGAHGARERGGHAGPGRRVRGRRRGCRRGDRTRPVVRREPDAAAAMDQAAHHAERERGRLRV